jgi:uncharacterized protein (DUF58 family)
MLVAAGTALIAAGRVFGLLELYVLGGVALGLVVLAQLRVRRANAPLDVRRTVVPPLVHMGGQARVDLFVRNPGSRRSPVMVLRDPVGATTGAVVAVAPVMVGEHQAAGYRVPAERRGVLTVGPLRGEVFDPFGLASRSWELAPTDSLTVLPAVEVLSGPIRGGGLDDPLAGVTQPMRGVRGDDDFSGLRPYVVGDDLRRIHWPTTARTDELAVRQDDPPWQGHLTILLDARQDRINATRFEVAVSAAASLLSAVAAKGDRARLVFSDGTDSGLTDARASHDTLLERLAIVTRHPGSTLTEPPVDLRSRTGGLVLVTGSLGADEIALLTAQRVRFASVTAVVVGPARTTPHPPGLQVVAVDDGASFADAWARRGMAVR